jgi:hypothetical protein
MIYIGTSSNEQFIFDDKDIDKAEKIIVLAQGINNII